MYIHSYMWHVAKGFRDRHIDISLCLVIIDCLKMSQPENGRVTYHYNSTSYTNVALNNCDEGFKLEGESVLSCLANGNWSGNVPVCKKTGL